MEKSDIEALAAAMVKLQGGSSSTSDASTVPAVAIKLPVFWTSNPEIWLAQCEAQFATHNPAITADDTKFNHVVAALDNAAAAEVQAIILSPPASNKYKTLEEALCQAYGKSQDQKDQELLTMNGLGDRTPSALLRYMDSLNVDASTIKKALFLQQLPVEACTALATSKAQTLEALAKEADKVMESLRTRPTGTPVIGAAAAAPKPHHSHNDKKMCYYHYRFGDKSRTCKGYPCPLATEENTRQSGGGASSKKSGNSQPAAK